MKNVVIYLVCTAALFVAVVLTLSGGWWSLVGLAWCALLYISGLAFPKIWKNFWILNLKITKIFE